MATVEVLAEGRTSDGKGGARKLRAAGRVPGVIYGASSGSLPIAVDSAVFEKMLRQISSGNVILDIKLKGKEQEDLKAIIKEVQRDPVSSRIIHVDFQHIDMLKKVKVHVPVHLKGISMGVKEGGILEHLMRELEVECLPTEIPEEIAIDISALDKGQSIHIRDLDLAGLHVTDSPERTIVAVLTKAKEEVVAPVEAAPAAVAQPQAAPAGAKAAPAAKDAKPAEKGKAGGKN